MTGPALILPFYRPTIFSGVGCNIAIYLFYWISSMIENPYILYSSHKAAKEMLHTMLFSELNYVDEETLHPIWILR